MSIEARNSNEQVVGSKKYTGLANMLVRAINPTMEEIKALGGRADKEPQYTTNEFAEAKSYQGPDGEPYEVPAHNFSRTRIDIHLYIPQLKFSNKLAIWIDDRPRWNRDRTKVEWINKFGITAWTLNEQILEESQLTEPPDYSWFKKDSARPALVGEGQLSQFIRAWANVPLDSQASLDNPAALAKGDVSELRALLKDIPTNEVKILNGVKKVEKDGKVSYFAAAYTGYFDRANRIDYNDWRKALNGEYGKFEADYQGVLDWREWVGDSRVEGDSPTNLTIPDVANTPSTPPQYTF